MTPAALERKEVREPLLWISAVAWTLLLLEPRGMVLPGVCSGTMPGMVADSAPIRSLLTVTSVASIAAGWILMLVAMMAPALITPMRHVRDRSFAQRRARAILLFLVGYSAMWMAAGALLLAAGFVAAQLTARGSWAPLAVVAVVALAWQFAPLKQQCLNRCHNHTELAAFG
jgi:predicted metal-binding membrane protein